ncbi:biopolymer transporter ExbD [Leptospira bourretii]|uniref:Biopolymer transporter ExbD n=8 Tax=Leptospira TaxID=171 RepID=A0AAW5VF35_9LEPT|nr:MULTISPECIES: biopolymer transporter ExbD [Leptospira]PKA25519.1 biopolymer transporter ExbD [Leptospira sp. mixed culture ATI2-C-A1]EKJ86647.1 transport energizing protein, ExbD/TolR family [Leptospira meyeri serovar Hardjo str. Went 5]EMJ89317.1 transport energizing protein, ExbD/TolR family [Leptospira meyeri serovar Semaranga str. Veldrot Semarang 173]EMY62048.1 transport energizing protein, ExbD/TolR family [Leptospira terpstrae serovar Hualin str. LT 11-33 = ATCC 700639]MBM9548610.1 b
MAGASGSQDEEIGSINITPMVDVILVLLVIFMVTANFLKKESLNINLPKVQAADPNVAESVQVALTKTGAILLEGKDTDISGLVRNLEREAKIRPNMRLTLSADESLPYGKITELMGIIRKAGVTKIALSVKK